MDRFTRFPNSLFDRLIDGSIHLSPIEARLLFWVVRNTFGITLRDKRPKPATESISLAALAQKIGASRQQTEKAMSRLVRSGLIERHPRKGRNMGSVYSVCTLADKGTEKEGVPSSATVQCTLIRKGTDPSLMRVQKADSMPVTGSHGNSYKDAAVSGKKGFKKEEFIRKGGGEVTPLQIGTEAEAGKTTTTRTPSDIFLEGAENLHRWHFENTPEGKLLVGQAEKQLAQAFFEANPEVDPVTLTQAYGHFLKEPKPGYEAARRLDRPLIFFLGTSERPGAWQKYMLAAAEWLESYWRSDNGQLRLILERHYPAEFRELVFAYLRSLANPGTKDDLVHRMLVSHRLGDGALEKFVAGQLANYDWPAGHQPNGGSFPVNGSS